MSDISDISDKSTTSEVSEDSQSRPTTVTGSNALDGSSVGCYLTAQMNAFVIPLLAADASDTANDEAAAVDKDKQYLALQNLSGRDVVMLLSPDQGQPLRYSLELEECALFPMNRARSPATAGASTPQLTCTIQEPRPSDCVRVALLDATAAQKVADDLSASRSTTAEEAVATEPSAAVPSSNSSHDADDKDETREAGPGACPAETAESGETAESAASDVGDVAEDRPEGVAAQEPPLVEEKPSCATDARAPADNAHGEVSHMSDGSANDETTQEDDQPQSLVSTCTALCVGAVVTVASLIAFATAMGCPSFGLWLP
jgi:hypothetical protein